MKIKQSPTSPAPALRLRHTRERKRYPFTVSGMSVGFTIGAATTKLTGQVRVAFAVR